MKKILWALACGLTLLPLSWFIPMVSEAAYQPLPISAEDTAHSAGETLLRMGCRLNTAGGSSAGTTGDWATADCPNNIAVTATGMAVPAYAQIVIAALACYNSTTLDLCVPNVAHDASASSQNPVTIGGYSSAAAPTDVSADTEAVRAWFLRNGAQAVNLTAAGALIPGNATDGLLVNLGTNNDVTVTSGSITANAGTNLNTSALLTATNFSDAFGTAGTADSQVMSIQGIASMTPVQVQSNSANIATQTTLASILTAVELIDNDQTGASVHYRTSAGSTEDEHEVKATAGRLFSITATNTNAAARYLRCSNLTAANTTPGTSTVFLGMAIPGATTGAGFTVNFGGAKGIAFTTALTCWLVTGAADTDVAEVAANEIKVVYAYE